LILEVFIMFRSFDYACASLLLAACSAAAGAQDSAETTEGELTTRAPESARLTLLNTSAANGQPPLMFMAGLGKESFVLRGDAITFSVPTYQLWPTVHPTTAEPYSDLAREQQLHAIIHIAGTKDGAHVTDATVMTQGLRGGDGHSTFETFTDAPPYTVPSGIDSLEFTVEVKDDADGTTKTIPYTIATTAVLGSSLPDKTLLADELDGARRERVLEGGSLVSGSSIHVAFTDYRADNVVELYGIDRRIGRGRDMGAKDQMTDILGTIQHEVSIGYAFDGAWSPEQPLAENDRPRYVSGLDRKTFDGTLLAPRGAGSLALFFHVKTYLRYEYDHRQYHEVVLDHAEGSRALVRERWDNAANQPGRNYELTLEPR
jgi:hypothetical protein